MLERVLPRGSVQRTAVLTVAVVFLGWLVVMVALPGSGRGGRGTPAGVLFEGTVLGAVNGLAALGIVLIYRTSRFINFSQAALGAAAAVFGYNTGIVFGFPWGLGFLVALVLGAVFGIVVELFLRKFFDAPRLVVTILTIGLAALLGSRAVQAINTLPIWGEQRGLNEISGSVPYTPLPDWSFTVLGFSQPFGAAHIIALVVVAAGLAGVMAFLRFTRIGTAIRASAENTERAQLLGINVRSLSTIVWAVAGTLSAAAVFMLGSTATFSVGGQGAPEVLVAALAAAVLARMRSLPVAVVAAIGITILQRSVRWSFPGQDDLVGAGLFLVIAVGLLLQRRALQRGEEVSSWEATEEVRPTPKELLRVPGIRYWRRALVVIGALFVLAVPWITSAGTTNLAAFVAIYAIVLLSIVVLTGWAGQVSLSQFAFVAIGALVGGAITSRAGYSFWLAVPAGAIVSSVMAVLVGLPALRIKGLFLAVATFAFAVASASILFNEKYFGWLLPATIERPTALLLDFEDERSMYYLSVVFLALSVLVILGLRRTRPGRVLIAMRENETELQSFGINIIRTKLAAFALSGFLCGMAGVLLAHHQRSVAETAFTAQASIDVFIFAVLGGLASISGAILGAAFFAFESLLQSGDPAIAFFANKEFALIVVLYVAPGGLAAMTYTLRDAVLRIVAQRRQMVVPSLFEDYDPELLEKQLIPLGEAAPGTGLSALLHDQRYSIRSELYGLMAGNGDRRKHAPDESKILGAAAESAAAED